MAKSGQYIDVKASRLKYTNEVGLFKQNLALHRKRGILLLEDEFPDIAIAFSAVKLRPAPIVFAVRINFDNYDLVPPSVIFINPFTGDSINSYRDIPTVFKRRIPNSTTPQPLLQEDTGKIPFICIPGVREYHEHPRHTGNSWFLYRKKDGVGSLGYLVEKLYEYGIIAINSYQFPPIAVNQIGLGIDSNSLPE